jgi:tetratricopeptide (TPR) repeat protein
MSIDIDYNNRQLVPRLLSTRKSSILSFDVNYNKENAFKMNDYEKHNYLLLLEDWKKEKNLIVAIQILSYGIIHEELSLYEDALNYVKDKKNSLNKIELDILEIALRKKIPDESITYCCENNEDIKLRIKELKAAKKNNLINPFLWCDIGYYYTILGEKEKAKRAFLAAISLNNSNRYIVRSVARFFLHLDEYDFAHRVLVDSPRIIQDPGILAAEIAISELMERKSRYIDDGIRIVENDDVSLIEKNELMGQIATIEFAHGKSSKARKLVEKCLNVPNENILAQFEFISNTHRIDHEFDSKQFSVMCQYEALTRAYFNESNFEKSLVNAKLWLEFQPFSHKPAILASYIAAAVLNNHNEAIQIVQSALFISPESTALKNNLAFSLAKTGRIQEALNVLKSIKYNSLSKYEAAVLTATIGFVSYKSGNLEYAKNGYDSAIQYFRNNGYSIALTRALYNYSSVLMDSDIEKSKALKKEAYELSIKNNIVEIKYLLNSQNEKNNDQLIRNIDKNDDNICIDK